MSRMHVQGRSHLELHRNVLGRQRMLRAVFIDLPFFYQLNNEYLEGIGHEIEIGAGVAPVRDSYPKVRHDH